MIFRPEKAAFNLEKPEGLNAAIRFYQKKLKHKKTIGKQRAVVLHQLVQLYTRLSLLSQGPLAILGADIRFIKIDALQKIQEYTQQFHLQGYSFNELKLTTFNEWMKHTLLSISS